MMNDLFLKIDGVSTEEQAVIWAINAALQRNKVYRNEENYDKREKFRAEWANLIREESKAYVRPLKPISDGLHCAAITRVSESLSAKFGEYLYDGRLRFGTSQKAFNLYLKYLWAMGKIEMPPHCPIDSVVLAKAGINDCWTKNDSSEEYLGWINKIRERLTLAEWENEVWLRWRLTDLGL
jgi:hypothetical protein